MKYLAYLIFYSHDSILSQMRLCVSICIWKDALIAHSFFLISYFSAYLRGLLLETMVKACLAGLFFSFENQCLYIN